MRGHKGTITSLALSADDSRVFSRSSDGTVKMWNMVTGEPCRAFAYGSEVQCVATGPTSQIITVGTRDGRLRSTHWISGQCVFEYCTLGNGAISAVQFGTDGNFLVCGSTVGQGTSWRTSDWNKAASVNITGSITNISFHPDGTNAILGLSRGEIRHWVVSEKCLSPYNIATARPLNGLSFRNNGCDIIVGVKLGYARAWSGPLSNPGLDFEEFRNNVLFDFS